MSGINGGKPGSAERAIGLTRYFVGLPRARKTAALILLCGAVFGALIILALGQGFSLEILLDGVGSGIFLITVPAFLSAFTLYFARRAIPLRRVLFLSFIGALAYGAFYLASIFVSRAYPGLGSSVVFLGFGIIAVVWFAIARLVFGLGKSAFLFSLLQVFYNGAFLLASTQIALGGDWISSIVKMYVASLLFLAGLYALFFLLNAPMKRNIGIKSTDAISLFAAQWLNKDKGLEETFEEIGEEVETLLGAAVFEGRRGSTVFLAPYVHFGPFGNLGGSEWPKVLGQRLGKDADVFVFHGTVNNDFNPVSSGEIGKVISCYNDGREKMRMKPAEGFFSSGKAGDSSAICMRVNDWAFIGFSRAPKTTEDINFGLGLACMNLAKGKVREAVVVDAHNSETGDITTVEPGSPIQFEMQEALEKSLGGKGKAGKISLGTAKRMGSFGGCVGGNGIRVALFSSGKGAGRGGDANSHFAYIVLDSNGVTPEFRERIILRAGRWARERSLQDFSCEIFTTDTHEVNMVRGVLNPIGKNGEEGGKGGDVERTIMECLDEALGRMEPVKAGVMMKRFRLNVFGAKQSTEVVATISAIIAIARIAVPAVLAGTVLAVLWALSRV